MTVAPGEFIRRFLLHVLPKGFHRIRHYGLLAQQPHQGRHDRAGARADRRGGAATATAADEAGSGDRWHRGDRQADPSLPMLRWSHGHHRDVRGRLDAATSARPRRRSRSGSTRHDADRTSITRHCRLDCAAGSTAGNDDARPQSSIRRHATDLATPADPAFSTLVWPTIASTPLIRGINARCTRPPLHRQRQPNPHSAR